ncbi:hypothetical protein A6R68_22206 [Neotoma lepida]|uniref:MACPF domain-containing protein n=1 Tax=Neotoma lepida TaxID=56216 RepID=A0A1A6HPD2_NEOLE|nr:hypothetical protein A6R68_22206 [Neotoma lepida]
MADLAEYWDGFTNVLKILTKESSRDELLSFIQHYGSHYIAEALYGSELTCIIHFPSKKSKVAYCRRLVSAIDLEKVIPECVRCSLSVTCVL